MFQIAFACEDIIEKLVGILSQVNYKGLHHG